jgi:outer membrane protein assembly factor BamA
VDSTRGSFLSNGFEVAPPGIGSSIKFYKNFTQFFYFHPVRQLVWATGVRAGFANGFENEEILPTDRFQAGGSSTVRGFKQNRISLEPGDALFVLNQELRFPIRGRFSGAAFFDAGNVFKSVSEWNPFDSRPAVGFGLRFHTPYILLRFDMGFNLRPRDGEARTRFFFGLGQAF